MNFKSMFIIVGLFTQLAFAAGKDVSVKVNGMVCAFCGQGISKKFKAEDSVEKVDVSLTDKLVKLSLRDNKQISDERITEILKDSGYSVVSIERK